MVQICAMEKVGETVFAQSFGELECRAVVFAVDEDQTLLELNITEGDTVRWSRKSAELPEDDWAFGCWLDGPAFPCLFVDLDHDGKPELLVPVPKADLSPTVYRVFRWDGQQLSLIRKSALIADSSGEFVWTTPDPEQDSQIKWVDTFEDGVARVIHQRRATTSHRTMTLAPSKRGFAEAT